MEEEEEEEEVDRMSELPEDIIQHIQSFLDIKQGTQSTLLSKSWLRAWSTHPILDFNSDTILDPKLVIKNLRSHLKNRIPILKFRLSWYAMDAKWVKLVLQNNLIELDIYIARLDDEVASSWRRIFMIKSLQVLKVYTEWHRKSELVLSRRDIKCHNLKKLDLSYVKIDDVNFQHVARYCPLIEELRFYCCNLLNFRASNLPNLKILRLKLMTFKNLDVSDAPRLQTLIVKGAEVFHIGACASLKVLSLRGFDINDEQLQTILSKNPQLADLTLLRCDKLVKRINLSGLSSLKRFKFDRSWKELLQEIIIDAPNLHRLKYNSFISTTPFPITSPITKVKVNVSIVYSDTEVDESWFHGLREFLAKFAKTNVKINLLNHMWRNFEELRATPLPYLHQVETLTFKRRFPWLPFMYSFLTICHPKTVLFKSDHSANYYFEHLTNLWKALRYRGNLECCKLDRNKCWRHYIKDAKLYHVVDNEQRPLDMNELIVGYGQMVISLALEWRECSD